MNEIRQRVRQARRRLMTQRFLQVLPVCLLITLAIALAGVVWPKLSYVAGADENWPWYWIGGGVAAGLISALLWTWLHRHRSLEAAIEIDRRFGLKERISSALALDEQTLQTPAGVALLSDAERAAGRIEVAAAFPVQVRWHGLLPLGVAVLAVALAVGLDNASPKSVEASSLNRLALKKEIDRSVKDLKKKLEQQKKELEQKGLDESKELFELLQKKLDDLQKNNKGDYKKTFVEINNLAKKIDERRQELGGAREVQKQLEQQLKDVSQGPAEKLARALKNGRWGEAQQQLEQLAKQLEQDKMTPADKAKLKKQIEQLKKQLDQLQQDYEQAKRDLEEQIAQKKRSGDLDAVNQLQKKLDQLKNQQNQMDRLSDLAQKLGECQQCMGKGDGKGAAQAMRQIAKAMGEMEAESQELQALSDAMDEIAEAKQGLAKACQGMGKSMGLPSDDFSLTPSRGLGHGRGAGARPEEETKTGTYRSRVRGNPKKGEVVRIGDANGPNRTGQSTVQAAEQVESAFKEDPDPIVQEKLPRLEKRQATEYFEKLRRGD